MSTTEHSPSRPGAPVAREAYTLGYGERVVQHMAARSASVALAFFLPHLQPGVRVLDCGCGPGSITADVAESSRPAK